ncbi:hypothetical protein Si129_01026 [Streptococcus infantarius subsp. infantarius]|uniref:DUF7010 family protein n=1 Tax=Streptococcus infantarius TaxID=102684 RepID=UPI00208EE044|nr:hypothetical protein [Streptococcus infantarius]MCO4480344.1 hypothetical protein [Streptococcus infantarius subsp. infantarius]MCO4481745.1 hypothetical protein [Streptococcus infantarius subsp. infantarius]MCO4486696.1 hypothetical protein [Streptococcus infantarius subsp. infantarius]MCO4494542.1 hypothetical protein [Streptococcus infantarius subsp. infantarius]MCO4496354.1 hypothetical protein [Streptococcus infantarius subsp. infantarius]
MELEVLRKDMIVSQRKGQPFIVTSTIIWVSITLVTMMKVSLPVQNLLIFLLFMSIVPLSWFVGKWLNVDIFSKENPLTNLGFLFTCNQLIYLLIVMWVFSAVPEKMLMVYTMVFGAHLLPYSWLYKSRTYFVFAILIPILALVLGHMASMTCLSLVMVFLEIVFAMLLQVELNANK